MDRFIVVASLALVVVVFGLIGAITFGAPAPAGDHYTADDAIAAARQFVSTEKTFKFDGMADTLTVRMNKTISDSASREFITFMTARLPPVQSLNRIHRLSAIATFGAS